MLTFDRGNARFNFRSVGVLIADGKVLLHRDRKDDFWSLPGGRAEFFETARDAVVRELREELDATVEVDRPLWFVENFFDYEGKRFHEVSVFFLLELVEPCSRLEEGSFYGVEEGRDLLYKWFPLSGLKDVKLYPAFLSEGLSQRPSSMEYLVWRDKADG